MANTINTIVSGLRTSQPIIERLANITVGTPKANRKAKQYVPTIVIKGEMILTRK